MSVNEGLLNEQRMILALNNKKFEELNPNLQTFVMQILPDLDKSRPIECFKCKEYTKPDIVISQGKKVRYISLKTGTADTMHSENVDTFVEFLRENGFDDYSIESYLLYHYGDGTTDGTGTDRLGVVAVREKYDKRITALNDALNKSKDFLKKFADRVMWQGVNPLEMPADVIYHGTEEYGCFMSKYQLTRHLERKSWSYMQFVLHVGPFVIRPRARYPGKEIKNDEFRRKVIVYYPRILADIPWIRSRYFF